MDAGLLLERVSLLLLLPFSACLALTVARRPSIFLRRHGRPHRLLGALHLLWLAFGLADVAAFPPGRQALRFFYDVALGVLGTALTLTAASGFDHRRVVNAASGALDADATVTHAEMVEHTFYQLLNLSQVLYLHAVAHAPSRSAALLLCACATAPWLARGAFPVNSFSANWRAAHGRAAWGRERLLYRLKKAQYLLYKHALLHGLNVSVALAAERNAIALPQQRGFHLFWVCLNAAYVLEFFLQSLVKRRIMAQRTMLTLNALLMAASTAAALPVLRRVRLVAALASLALNFARRGRELSNTALVAALSATLG